VNGVIWPKKSVVNGNYRIRLVDGSDSRCYNLSFTKTDPWAGGTLGPKPTDLIPFTVIANEQGYLQRPVITTEFAMCPGERYEFVFDFSRYAPGTHIYMINDARAPFPGDPGTGPFDPGSPYPDMATIMRFDVYASNALTTPISKTPIAAVPTCAKQPATLPASCLWIPPILDQNFVALTDGAGNVLPTVPVSAVRNLFLNERVDGTTGASLGLQINGVPFEYDVTETPQKGTYEVWNIINATVDAHPIHPHLVKAQIVRRQDFDVGGWRLAMCQGDPADNACTFGPAPGLLPQLVVDPAGTLPGTTNYLIGSPAAPPALEAGWKDAMRAYPGQVLTFVAKWDGEWRQSSDPRGLDVTAPGSGNPNCFPTNVCTVSSTGIGSSVSCTSSSAVTSKCGVGDAAYWVFPSVTSGPYVWHCHINSHEDSEMMRTSLVVP
jgi:FtsP/CotA-like multicopper oxidase with cupredoxin domain